MTFQKGNKLGGRTKGAKNITTWQKEMFVKYIEEEGAPALLEDLRTLDPKDRVHYMTSLLPYAFAKRAPVNDKGETVAQVIPILDVSKDNSDKEDNVNEEKD